MIASDESKASGRKLCFGKFTILPVFTETERETSMN